MRDGLNLVRVSVGVTLGSTAIATQFFSSNVEPVQVSVWLFIVPVIGFALGGLWGAVVLRKASDWRAASLSGSMGSLSFCGGGFLADWIGLFSLAAPILVMWAAYITYRRLEKSLKVGWLASTWFVWLVLVNIYFLVMALSTPPSHVPITSHCGSSSRLGQSPDVIVLILDEMASLEVRPLLEPIDFSHEIVRGYSVRKHIWSAYVTSRSSIAAMLDGSYQLREGERIDEMKIRELGRITRGDNCLVAAMQAAGYQVALVESGVWMTGCGHTIDHCVPRFWLDEAVGTIVERSALRPLYQELWGDNFSAAGLYSIDKVEEAAIEAARNRERDAIVAHITLPHAPYILDRSCQRVRTGHERPSLEDDRVRDAVREAQIEPEIQHLYLAYAQQAQCALGRVVALLEELDRQSSISPAVVVAGDHGTALHNQLYRDSSEWSHEDMVERLSAFAMYRLPQGCEDRNVDTTAQLMDLFISCFTGGTPGLGRKHYLDAPAGGPALEVPSHALPDPH